MATYMESGWLYLITHSSDFQLMTFGTFFVSVFMLLSSELAFTYVERIQWLNKYKIQAKTVRPEDKQTCVTRVLMTYFGIIFPIMFFSYPIFVRSGMKTTLPLPSWYEVVFDILLGFILNDFFLYFAHRLLHTKWLYKHVHSVHHEYATPFGLTAAYAHPAEFIILGMINTNGLAIVARPHLITYWIWIIAQSFVIFEAHCGYHFPWSPSNFLPFYGGAEFHDVHHRLSTTNLGFTFTYMDQIFGTDKGHKKLKALKAGQMEEKHKEM